MNEKTKSILSLFSKIAVAGIILTVIILNYDRLTNLDVRALIENASSIYAAVGILLAVFFGKSLLFVIPASLIYISIGMALKPLTAILVSFLGISIEVMTTFLLGKFLGGDTVNKLLSKSESGKKLLEKNVADKFSVLFVMRFSGLPIDFTSLFLGASGCGVLKYYTASICGIMPRVILFTFLGDRIYDIIPMELLIKIIICLIPAAVVFFVIRHFISKKKKAEQEAETAEPTLENGD